MVCRKKKKIASIAKQVTEKATGIGVTKQNGRQEGWKGTKAERQELIKKNK